MFYEKQIDHKVVDEIPGLTAEAMDDSKANQN